MASTLAQGAPNTNHFLNEDQKKMSFFTFNTSCESNQHSNMFCILSNLQEVDSQYIKTVHLKGTKFL